MGNPEGGQGVSFASSAVTAEQQKLGKYYPAGRMS